MPLVGPVTLLFAAEEMPISYLKKASRKLKCPLVSTK
jgi:hypothetical protein